MMSLDIFTESDNLNAVLNYRQGLMRSGPAPTPDDVRSHRSNFLCLGATANAFSTMLLPGAPTRIEQAEALLSFFRSVSVSRGGLH